MIIIHVLTQGTGSKRTTLGRVRATAHEGALVRQFEVNVAGVDGIAAAVHTWLSAFEVGAVDDLGPLGPSPRPGRPDRRADDGPAEH